LILTSGCCKKPEVIIETKEVKIPVKCIVPEVKCHLKDSMNSIDTIALMVACIGNLKEASKVCK